VSAIINAPRPVVYRACLDPEALVVWRVPDNMEGHLHSLDPRAGGRYRMSLTYKDPQQSPGGKTSESTDTFEGSFVELVPYQKIVEVVEFESEDSSYSGEMTMTTRLADVDDATQVTVICEGLPAGIRPEDNELGTRQALRKLAALLSA
jgi:uncharacterized protein YndB with AHSA1/START domain